VGIYQTATRFLAGAGTQTAGLAFGGYTTANTAATEEYSGYTWAAGGNLGTARRYIAGCGITNSRFSIWWIYNS
jgi:hypothetical protein